MLNNKSSRLTPSSVVSTIQGLTLIELLVTLVIMSFLAGSLLSAYLAAAQRTKAAMNNTRLDQSLQSAMRLMTNDIRRAGFWGKATSGVASHANNNPFMASGTDLTINGSGNCLLFTYDQNGDGTVASINASADDEHYGYRLMNKTLQARPWGADFSCGAAATNWENITDPNVVTITALSFTENDKTVAVSTGSSTMKIRFITVSLTGQLASDSTVSKTLTGQVRIRNDKYAP